MRLSNWQRLGVCIHEGGVPEKDAHKHTAPLLALHNQTFSRHLFSFISFALNLLNMIVQIFENLQYLFSFSLYLIYISYFIYQNFLKYL